MNIEMNKKLAKTLSTAKACQREFGKKAEYIMKKIEEIRNLIDCRGLWKLQGNFHELKHGAKGIFSLIVHGGLRMVMRLAPSYKAIELIAIEDYHGTAKRIIKYNNI